MLGKGLGPLGPKPYPIRIGSLLGRRRLGSRVRPEAIQARSVVVGGFSV